MIRLRFIGKTLALPAGILLAVAIPGPAAHAQAAGQWQFTGSMAVGHSNWSNTGFAQMPDGRVLAISGSSGPGALTSDAESYDPGTGQWTPAGTLNNARYAFGPPSVLPDGDVLVAGGHDVNVNDYATAELYDPATRQWTFTGSLNTSRRYPVQVELANGEVLVATGSHGPPTCTRYLSSAELYNPATGLWTYTGSTLVPRESATAIRLADGRVLLAGGYNGGGSACTDTDPVDTEIYDPATGQWSLAGNLPHGWLGGAMVLLRDHRVLMVDGWQHGSGNFAEAVIFDPATGQWSEAAQPGLPRSGAAATLLPDGNVLVSQGGQAQSEIYDPTGNTWSPDATTLDINNAGHTFLLPDGNVLLAGGSNSTGPSTTAELYAATVTIPSNNYAGLAAFPANSPAGFRHVDASWQEPHLACNGPWLQVNDPRTPTVAIWTGLGGIKDNAQLIQIGTADSCQLGKVEAHLAFFQVFPLDRTPTLIPRLVLPGDKITAQIDYNANSSTYTATMKDTNTRPGPFGSWTYTIQRSDTVLADPLTRSSAEWIAERPTTPSGCADNVLRPLANFNSVSITGTTGAAASQFTAYEIAGTSSENMPVLAGPASWSTTASTGTASVDVKWNALGCNI
jgi:hypothetical protein